MNNFQVLALSPVAIIQIATDSWTIIPTTMHHTITGDDSTETPSK